jgi:hypothetical protein
MKLLALSSFVAALAAGSGPGTAIDPAIARVILSDSRLLDFHAAIEAKFDVQCDLPEPTHLEAEVNQLGSGDFASTLYTFQVTCFSLHPAPGQVVVVDGKKVNQVGLSLLTITAEQTQLQPDRILDLNIATRFRQ